LRTSEIYVNRDIRRKKVSLSFPERKSLKLIKPSNDGSKKQFDVIKIRAVDLKNELSKGKEFNRDDGR
jgi:hypothetical protein